jgi:hypothetical protein
MRADTQSRLANETDGVTTLESVRSDQPVNSDVLFVSRQMSLPVRDGQNQIRAEPLPLVLARYILI